MLRAIHTLDQEGGLKLVNQIKADVGIEPGTDFYPVGARRKWQIDEKKSISA